MQFRIGRTWTHVTEEQLNALLEEHYQTASLADLSKRVRPALSHELVRQILLGRGVRLRGTGRRSQLLMAPAGSGSVLIDQMQAIARQRVGEGESLKDLVGKRPSAVYRLLAGSQGSRRGVLHHLLILEALLMAVGCRLEMKHGERSLSFRQALKPIDDARAQHSVESLATEASEVSGTTVTPLAYYRLCDAENLVWPVLTSAAAAMGGGIHLISSSKTKAALREATVKTR
jgi:hypothetical protein